jgi:hypothetical protein
MRLALASGWKPVAPDSGCSPSGSNRPGLDEDEEGTLAPAEGDPAPTLRTSEWPRWILQRQ